MDQDDQNMLRVTGTVVRVIPGTARVYVELDHDRRYSHSLKHAFGDIYDTTPRPGALSRLFGRVRAAAPGDRVVGLIPDDPEFRQLPLPFMEGARQEKVARFAALRFHG